MTIEEATRTLSNGLVNTSSEHEWCMAFKMLLEASGQMAKALQFAIWVANEIFDEGWDDNKNSFEEIACRKFAELGIVRANGDEWELVELQAESENKK